jgi:REP element-mobilizing transposase RayT
MPRKARQKSETDIYHVMLRGINQTQLFYEDADRIAFMDRLQRYRNECGFVLYAYCLMGNHVHLLIKEGEMDLSLVIKKLALSYSFWFNSKYDRSGYLFQGRYKREPVTSDEYLLVVVRYIHNNPVMIGESIALWTSYNEYVKTQRIVDVDLVLGLLDGNRTKARKQFVKFSELPPESDESVLDEREYKRNTDATAIKLIKDVANVTACQDLIDFERNERNRVLALLKNKGLSIRQISRLTGINRGIVQKASNYQQKAL